MVKVVQQGKALINPQEKKYTTISQNKESAEVLLGDSHSAIPVHAKRKAGSLKLVI